MATTNMKKLSAYTIAKNCSDIDDVHNGLEELRDYFTLCDKEGKYYVDDIEQLYNAIIDNHVELRAIFDKYQNIGYIKKSITI